MTGNQDAVTKRYMSRSDIFADIFNYLIYQGRTVIQADTLRQFDSEETADLSGKKTETKYRDVMKRTVVKTDGKTMYLLLGIENQMQVHYAMPVRAMVYDALRYDRQVREIARGHAAKGENRALGKAGD
ncbi:MAG: hypothetical protein Q4C60_10080 [Eubacteriales bacterium]|nr:hypothetical protein [Eubacteriales bacterium]